MQWQDVKGTSLLSVKEKRKKAPKNQLKRKNNCEKYSFKVRYCYK